MPRIAPTDLEFALWKRALTWRDLKLSKPTTAKLRAGAEVSAGTVKRVDAVLRTTPPLESAAELWPTKETPPAP